MRPMTDYTTLLRGLREYQQHILPPMLCEAADAIEALQAECERLRCFQDGADALHKLLVKERNEAILECGRLRAELAVAQKDAERLRDERAAIMRALNEKTSECLALNAELAAAQKDADRYRWLRRGFRLEKAYDIYKDGGRWWTAFHVADNRLSVDAAIDAAMAQEKSE